jgi:hypothetical protein
MMDIILLHGMGGRSYLLYPLYYKLKLSCNIKSINIVNYDTNSFDITYKQICDKILNLHNSNTPLIIIGLSYGGLLATQLYKKLNIILAIAIASPLKHNKFLHYLKKQVSIKVWKKLIDNGAYDSIIKKDYKPPPHKYKTISTSLPLSKFDGCVYKNETYWDIDNHIHIHWSIHGLISVDYRLINIIVHIINNLNKLSKL